MRNPNCAAAPSIYPSPAAVLPMMRASTYTHSSCGPTPLFNRSIHLLGTFKSLDGRASFMMLMRGMFTIRVTWGMIASGHHGENDKLNLLRRHLANPWTDSRLKREITQHLIT